MVLGWGGVVKVGFWWCFGKKVGWWAPAPVHQLLHRPRRRIDIARSSFAGEVHTVKKMEQVSLTEGFIKGEMYAVR